MSENVWESRTSMQKLQVIETLAKLKLINDVEFLRLKQGIHFRYHMALIEFNVKRICNDND